MNADGLVASLTFGGSPAQGAGFAVILIIRYVLETCSTVAEAVAALCRVPVAMYRPAALTVDYLWPGHVMSQGIGLFTPGPYVHDYGELEA